MIDKIIALSQIEISPTLSDKKTARVEKRNAYYAKVLPIMHSGKLISWNWAAGLFTNGWLGYRKAYTGSIAVVLGCHLLENIYHHFFLSAQQTPEAIILKAIIMLSYWMSLIVLGGLFGNKIYYEHLKRKVSEGYLSEFYNANNWDVIKWPTVFGLLFYFLSLCILGLSEIQHFPLIIMGTQLITLLTLIIVMRFDYVKSRNALRNYVDDNETDQQSLEATISIPPDRDDPQQS
jgi:hypothetical protein